MKFSAGRILLPGLLVVVGVFAQPPLRLKTRTVTREGSTATATVPPGHSIIQFDVPPSADIVAALANRGIRVLADVPENGLLIATDIPADLTELGVRLGASIQPQDKVSPMLSRMGSGGGRRGTPVRTDFLVEFHSDIDMNAARGMILNLGLNLELRENPDLAPHHLMIRVADLDQAVAALARLSERDEVAYIFPASDELMRGGFVAACAGAITANGLAGQLIAAYGDGWDGAGRNPTTLGYVMGAMTPTLPAGTAQAEILRAMSEWSKVIKLSWVAGSNTVAARTVNIFFAAGSHGDGYPFDGPGKVLAHTFYPAPPNPEPIAGDMHLDGDEIWRVGANMDVFSVALHELGHALGLGHSDDPNAVMYPYYRMATTLGADDKNAILALYAAADGTPVTPPPPTPQSLTLGVNVPSGSTTAASLALSGTVTGGTVLPSVKWTSSTGASGTAQLSGGNWSIASVALNPGTNTITITAISGTQQVSRSVTISRLTAADTTAPSLQISSPTSTTFATTASSINMTGTASDNVGVTLVSYSTNTGFSGNAVGTTQWSAAIPLRLGTNSITVRAYDAAGNSSWRTVIVTRR